MDGIILLFACILFLIFLIVHILVIRKYQDQAVLVWLLKIFFGVALGGCILVFIFGAKKPIQELLFATTLIFVLYGLVTLAYVQAIFGITLTSLRIQLLTELFNAKNQHMKISELLKKYNRKVLIRQRLFRLVSSGVVGKENGTFFLKNKTSPYFVHIYIADFLYRLYK